MRFSESDQLLYIAGMDQLMKVSKKNLISDVSSQRILILVHGFNNPFSYVLQEYLLANAQFRGRLSRYYDCMLGYTWPGGSSRLNYFQAKQNTEEAGNRLRRWLQTFTDAECTIDIIGHSMAALVGFKALREDADINIRNIFSMGAAIPKDILKAETALPNLFGKVQNLYAFITRDDGILRYGYRLVEWKEALGYAGPARVEELVTKYPKINVIDCTSVIHSHNAYLRSEEVMDFISEVIRGANNQQFVELRTRTTESDKGIRSQKKKRALAQA